MWTFSNKQLEAIKKSLVEVSERLTKIAIEKGVDAVDNIGQSNSPNPNSKGDGQQISKTSEQKTGTSGTNSPGASQKTQSNKKNGTETKKETATKYTTNPIMPCEQYEVISVSATPPAEMPPKKVTAIRWLTEEGEQIKSSLTEREVKIEIITSGIPDGYKLKIHITDSANKVFKQLELTINENKTMSDLFVVENEWIDKILFVKIQN